MKKAKLQSSRAPEQIKWGSKTLSHFSGAPMNQNHHFALSSIQSSGSTAKGSTTHLSHWDHDFIINVDYEQSLFPLRDSRGKRTNERLLARHARHVSMRQAISRSLACLPSYFLNYLWADRETARSQFFSDWRIIGSLCVPGKLPNYPSLNPAFCPTW